MIIVSMTQVIPDYSQQFSIETNNLPFPNQSNKLHNRFNRWKNRFNPVRRPNYERIPESEIQETQFNTPEDTRIQIESDPVVDIPLEFAESAPLLGTAAGGTALLGGAGSALGTGGSLATGILGATIIGAGAYGIKKLSDRAETKGYTLPNSEYIGPGNPIPIGAAKNPTEQIAKDHDLAYSNAKTHSDVQSADKDAYTKFRDQYHKSGDYYAKIAQLGLQAKSKVEDIIGVQYPRNLGK